MKTIIVALGMLSISSVASASGVTKVQSAAAKRINSSQTARRDGITVKPSAIQFKPSNARGTATLIAKTKPGAFPTKVTIKVDDGKLSTPTFKAAGKPNVDY
jgi:hypothetical protein